MIRRRTHGGAAVRAGASGGTFSGTRGRGIRVRSQGPFFVEQASSLARFCQQNAQARTLVLRLREQSLSAVTRCPANPGAESVAACRVVAARPPRRDRRFVPLLPSAPANSSRVNRRLRTDCAPETLLRAGS